MVRDPYRRRLPLSVSGLLGLDLPEDGPAPEDPRVALGSFEGLNIYGWDFFDPAKSQWNRWKDRLSLDVVWSLETQAHAIELFQEGRDRHLDLWIWFDDMQVSDAHGVNMDEREFAAGGVRWWDALYQNDPRTDGRGILPLSSSESPSEGSGAE